MLRGDTRMKRKARVLKKRNPGELQPTKWTWTPHYSGNWKKGEISPSSSALDLSLQDRSTISKAIDRLPSIRSMANIFNKASTPTTLAFDSKPLPPTPDSKSDGDMIMMNAMDASIERLRALATRDKISYNSTSRRSSFSATTPSTLPYYYPPSPTRTPSSIITNDLHLFHPLPSPRSPEPVSPISHRPPTKRVSVLSMVSTIESMTSPSPSPTPRRSLIPQPTRLPRPSLYSVNSTRSEPATTVRPNLRPDSLHFFTRSQSASVPVPIRSNSASNTTAHLKSLRRKISFPTYFAEDESSKKREEFERLRTIFKDGASATAIKKENRTDEGIRKLLTSRGLTTRPVSPPVQLTPFELGPFERMKALKAYRMDRVEDEGIGLVKEEEIPPMALAKDRNTMRNLARNEGLGLRSNVDDRGLFSSKRSSVPSDFEMDYDDIRSTKFHEMTNCPNFFDNGAEVDNLFDVTAPRSPSISNYSMSSSRSSRSFVGGIITPASSTDYSLLVDRVSTMLEMVEATMLQKSASVPTFSLERPNMDNKGNPLPFVGPKSASRRLLAPRNI